MSKLADGKQKRFIAGAVCPACSKMDTLVMMEENGVKVFQCVSCDYIEYMNEPNESENKVKKDKPQDVIQWLTLEGE